MFMLEKNSGGPKFKPCGASLSPSISFYISTTNLPVLSFYISFFCLTTYLFINRFVVWLLYIKHNEQRAQSETAVSLITDKNYASRGCKSTYVFLFFPNARSLSAARLKETQTEIAFHITISKQWKRGKH